MFQTLRRWWHRGRGKVTARLFFLELVVVVVGVFIAQALADWNDRRSAMASMEVARERLDRDLGIAASVAVGWERAIPCIDERVTAIMHMVAEKTPVNGQMIKRPGMQTLALPLPSDNDQLLLARRYGAEVAQTYFSAGRNAEYLNDHIKDLAKAWGSFALIDPTNGAASENDRHAARQAAAQIKASLRGMEINAANVRERAASLEIRLQPNGSQRVIRDCNDLWRTGMTHPVPRA